MSFLQTAVYKLQYRRERNNLKRWLQGKSEASDQSRSWAEVALDLAETSVTLASAGCILGVSFLISALEWTYLHILPRWIMGFVFFGFGYSLIFTFGTGVLSLILGVSTGNWRDVVEVLKK